MPFLLLDMFYLIVATSFKFAQMAKGYKMDDGGDLLYEQDSQVSKAIMNGVEPNTY